MKEQYESEESTMPFAFLIRSDGGTDRNPKNASVQIGCIYNFLKNDLDFVIYLITAADVSHVNEVEGVMPIANLVLQNQAYCREEMSEDMEKKFKLANSGKAIRNVIDDEINDKKREASLLSLQKSMSNVKNELNNRFREVTYCKSKVQIFDAANDDEINESFLFIKNTIDDTFDYKKQTWTHIYQNNAALTTFLLNHTRHYRYYLEVFKCNKISCNVCKPVRMPKGIWMELSSRPNFIPHPEPIDIEGWLMN